MLVTRRDFLKEIAFVTAIIGVPDWAKQLDEPSAMEMFSSLVCDSNYPRQWSALPELDAGNPAITALNRITFGPRPGDFEYVQKIGVDAFIEEQLAPEKNDDSALEAKLDQFYPTLKMSTADLMRIYPQPTAEERQKAADTGQKLPPGPAQVIAELQEATLMRAIYSRQQLKQVLTDFWTDHFTIYIAKNACKWLKTVDDREVIRKNALGKFGDLLRASAQSPAMLEYLDNRLNVKGVPNENYAREIMELHTLGVDGGYTQKDVQELARAFTGWTYQLPKRANLLGGVDYTDAGKFIFNATKHDTGPKKILGIDLPGNGGMDEAMKIVDALAKHPSTAQHVSKKLVMRFVSDNPPAALVQRAAQTFTQTNGDIRAVLSVILHSDEFKNSFAQKIKRPFEFVVSAARALDAQFADPHIFAATLRLMGQGLFLRMTPDGYPDVATEWVNTGALLARWNYAILLAGNRVPRVKTDLAAMMNSASVKTNAQGVDFWIDAILHRALPAADRQKFLDALGGNAPANFNPARAAELVALILASPHFQYR